MLPTYADIVRRRTAPYLLLRHLQPCRYLVFELLDCDLKYSLDTVKWPASHDQAQYMGHPYTGLHPTLVKWYTYQLLAGVQA